MKKTRLALAATLATLASLAGPASANSSGIAGFTGKDGATCASASCHQGGTAPTVTLEGPTTLAAGATGDFTLTVTGDTTTAGAVAAPKGAKLTAGTGLRDATGELVQSAPQGATGTFTFKLTAPTTGTTMRLYAVGLGGAALGTSDAKAVTKDIAVTGGAPATETPPEETTPSGNDPDDSDNPIRKRDPFADDPSGCSATRRHVDTSGIIAGALVAVGLLLSRRHAR